MKTTFVTRILGLGNNTGIEVPAEKLAELGSSKRPPVTVDVNGYTYRSTVAVMGGRYMVPFARAHREASGLGAGDEVSVTLQLDPGTREVEVPKELQAALKASALGEIFDGLPYSKRKEFARQVRDAKAAETKTRRIDKIIEQLQQ